jgi:hypothetical protein
MQTKISIDVILPIFGVIVVKVMAQFVGNSKSLAVRLLVRIYRNNHVSLLPNNCAKDVIVCGKIHSKDAVFL